MSTSIEHQQVEEEAQFLAKKVHHFLMTILGRLPEQAHPIELFQALSYALREKVIANWIATTRTIHESQARRVYYLSMEYLPGRMLLQNVSNLHAHHMMKRVAHLCNYDYRSIAELEPDLGLGNGGLGRLASCLMESLATQRYPAMGYGLRYQYGIFEQQLWDGVQMETPDCWLLHANPWGLRHDHSAQTIKLAGKTKEALNAQGEHILHLTDYEMVRAIAFDFPIIGFSKKADYNVNTLRLWSTKESPRNFQLQRYNAGQIGAAAENTTLTDVLYPNDDNDMGKRTRLKQEFLLVSASLQDIIERHFHIYQEIRSFADKVRIQINDTHPTLVVAELTRILMTHYDYTLDEAWEVTSEVVSYTNHTILPEALEEWNQERLRTLLPRQHRIIELINDRFLKKVPTAEKKESLSIIHNGQVRMAHLAIIGSHKVNGVAKLHGKILQEQTFKDFLPLYPDKFTYVTNGVTQRHWLWQSNPMLSEFITELIGDKWVTDFSEIKKLANFASDPAIQTKFLAVKQKNKERLVRFIDTHCFLHDAAGRSKVDKTPIALDSLFDVQIKRIHEYKRQLMSALHVIMLYFDLLENPKSRLIKRTVIVAGKAAAGYHTAKAIIHLIYLLGRKINHDARIGDRLKVIFLENYSVTKAEHIIPAAELSTQISTAGMEASGTGNMKLTMNGALTIGTEDGANIEMREAVGDKYWPFSFGAHVEELHKLEQENSYHPKELYLQEPKIKQAVDALTDGTFTESSAELASMQHLTESLLTGSGGQKADRYFMLYDLMAYYKMQQKVELLYTDSHKWAEFSLYNMAGMSTFSSDVSVKKYAEDIWQIKPYPVDPEILREVTESYKQTC